MRPPTDNQKLAACFVIFCLAAAICGWPKRESNFSYGGKDLDEWLLQLRRAEQLMQHGDYAPTSLKQILQQRADAEEAVYQMGPQVIPRLISVYDEQQSPWLAKLAKWCEEVGWKSHPFTNEPPPKLGVLSGLAVFGPDAAPALPMLSNALFQPEPDYELVNPLLAIGTPALPLLLSSSTNTLSRSGKVAYYGLAAMGTNARPIEASVRALLTHPDAEIRGRAQALLAGMAPLDQNPFPALLADLKNTDSTARQFAYSGLIAAARIRQADAPGMAEAAAAVADLANDTTSPDLRRRTAWGLRNFNTAAAPHIPVLLQLLKDPDERTRYGAVFALAALKLRPREVVPALIEMLSDPKEHIRQTAASGLRGMADEVEKLQPGFINTLGDLGKADFERDKLLREDFNKREAKRLERLKAKSVPKK